MRVHDAPVNPSNRQNLVRRAPARLSRMRASARACPSETALSLLRGALFMHRMRARILRIALSPLRGAILMHRMRACLPIIVFSPLRGAILWLRSVFVGRPAPAGPNFIEKRQLFYHTDSIRKNCVW